VKEEGYILLLALSLYYSDGYEWLLIRLCPVGFFG